MSKTTDTIGLIITDLGGGKYCVIDALGRRHELATIGSGPLVDLVCKSFEDPAMPQFEQSARVENGANTGTTEQMVSAVVDAFVPGVGRFAGPLVKKAFGMFQNAMTPNPAQPQTPKKPRNPKIHVVNNGEDSPAEKARKAALNQRKKRV